MREEEYILTIIGAVLAGNLLVIIFAVIHLAVIFIRTICQLSAL
jgi:hypothetical protein